MIWLAWTACGVEDIPPGWEDAQPVAALSQAECDGSASDTDVAPTVAADLGADPLVVDAGAVPFRCAQEVEAFWKQDGGTVEVLLQPRDMDPASVARCDCAYDFEITVGSPSPAAERLVVWRRADGYGGNDTTPERIGEVPSPCADRDGGALVTLDVVGESFTFWSTDGAFIDSALDDLATGHDMLPLFGQVVEGTDCDAQWSWHVDAAEMSWADFAIELCDARPSYIEANLADWIDQVGQWCPWSGTVTAVDDRR